MRLLILRSSIWPVLMGMIVCVVPLHACLWDHNTVEMETRLFPGALEVMTGQFPRHSAEYYVWRVADAHLKLMNDANNMAARDDLAVALHKLGRHAEADEAGKQSLKIMPYRYETLSNLGTFAIYTGDLSASCEWLKQALKINPEAHFGRERYQFWLVEQLMLKRDANAFPELTAGFSDATIKILQNDYARFV